MKNNLREALCLRVSVVKKLLVGLYVFIPTLFYASIDSSAVRKLITEGQKQFCDILDANDCAIAHQEYDKMRFVVDVGGNENYPLGYTTGGSNPNVSTKSPLKDSINSWIRQMYQQYNLELYLIFINTLNVEIKTPIPDSAKVRDLFCTSLYDDVGNLHEMEQLHEELAFDIVNNVISPRNRDCIILSTAEFKGVFKADGKISKWNFSKLFKHKSTERTFAALDEVYADYYRRIQSDGSCTSDLPEISAHAYVNDLAQTLKSQQMRSLLLGIMHPDPLKLVLVNFNYPQDYTDLTLAQRVHILSVFSGYPMLSDYFGNTGEERYTIKVISSTPKDQIEGLLDSLSVPSSLNSNPDYLGTRADASLIYVLMWRIDDSYWSEDNDYTKFIKAISDLMMSSETVIANHLPSTDEQWLRRKINWGGTTEGGIEDIGHQKYDVNMYSNGTVQVSSQIVSGWNKNTSSNINSSGVHPYTVVWSDNGTFNLNPFDLVFFTNRSNISMLETAGTPRNSVRAVPAIFLKYADDKDFDQAATSAFTTTLYVVGIGVGVLATGGTLVAAIEAADFALAAYAASQFIGVAGQIAADAIGNPTLKNVALAYNSIIGIWGVGELLANTSQMPAELLTAAKSGTIKRIPEGTAQAFKTDYELAQADLGELDAAVKEKLDRMEEYLGEEVENSTSPSGTFGPTYISSLSGFSDNLPALLAEHNLDMATFLQLEEKTAAELSVTQLETINAIRAEIGALNSNTVLQKCVPKCDIAKYLSGEYTSVRGYVTTVADAKHLETYEDIYYGIRLDYPNTKYSLGDGECAVIRFKASNAGDAYVPRSPANNNGSVLDAPPFTGHGFTGADHGRLGVPEWKMDGDFALKEGAELWVVDSNGNQTLKAIYDGELHKFVPIN
ncbi:MAG TPA: hypothetical protein VL651_15755 [Bacteroidia bacterium]|jgi:hypothetical protein|nr:hypothetical protein [Bacteroidia bacterium]